MTARTVASRLWLPVALLLGLALVIRLINLDGRNLWYDEAFAILFARQGLSAMLYGTLTPVVGGAADIHPLLYYVMLDGWMALFGESAVAARLLSVLLGVATVGMVYGLARDLFTRRVGLAAALVVTVAPFHVQYAQEARMYSLLALLLVLATWLFVRAWRWRRFGWRGAAGFGLLAALAMYTQQLAAFYLLALALVPLFWRDTRLLRWVMLGAALAMLVYAPWLVQLPAQWSKVGAYYWVEKPDALRFLLTLRVFFAGGTEPMPAMALLMLGGALLVSLFLAVQVAFVWRRLPTGARRALGLCLWLALVPPLLMWAVSQVRPVYLERALLPSALMLFVALGWLLASGEIPRPVTVGILAVLLAVSGAGLVSVLTWARFPNAPHREAAVLITDGWQPGDVVVHQSKLSALPMIVYAPTLDQRFVRDAPGSPEDTLAEPTRQVLGVAALDCMQAVASDSGRVWLVTYARLVEQARAAGRDDVIAGMQWFEAQYEAAGTWRLNDELDVRLFVSPDGGVRSRECA